MDDDNDVENEGLKMQFFRSTFYPLTPFLFLLSPRCVCVSLSLVDGEGGEALQCINRPKMEEVDHLVVFFGINHTTTIKKKVTNLIFGYF